jgi:hypothetical protein
MCLSVAGCQSKVMARSGREHIDLIVSYEQLCQSPQQVIERVLSRVLARTISLNVLFPKLRNLNQEYQRGANVRSNNRHYKEKGTFHVPKNKQIGVLPLSDEEVLQIGEICHATAQQLCAEVVAI